MTSTISGRSDLESASLQDPIFPLRRRASSSCRRSDLESSSYPTSVSFSLALWQQLSTELITEFKPLFHGGQRAPKQAPAVSPEARTQALRRCSQGEHTHQRRGWHHRAQLGHPATSSTSSPRCNAPWRFEHSSSAYNSDHYLEKKNLEQFFLGSFRIREAMPRFTSFLVFLEGLPPLLSLRIIAKHEAIATVCFVNVAVVVALLLWLCPLMVVGAVAVLPLLLLLLLLSPRKKRRWRRRKSLMIMETLSIMTLAGQAKIIGIIVCVGGSIFKRVYQGPRINVPSSPIHWKYIKDMTTSEGPAGGQNNIQLGLYGSSSRQK